MPTLTHDRVVVAGAGPTGLALACRLARRLTVLRDDRDRAST